MSEVGFSSASTLPSPTEKFNLFGTAPKPVTSVRLWPAVLLIALQAAVINLPVYLGIEPFGQFMAMFYGPPVTALALAVWWLFASRARWYDRLLIPLVFALVTVAAYFLADPSLKPHGFPMGLMIYGLPLVTTVAVVYLVVTLAVSWPARRLGLLLAFVLAWGYVCLVRLDGINGALASEQNFRWMPTAEERYLAEVAAKGTPVSPAAPAVEKVQLSPGDWPGFRGPNRDGRLPGVQIATDWKSTPPKELWRHRVGPGWSSLTVVGDRLYTQEQRGEQEAVACYRSDTGAELWAYTYPARLDDVIAGTGPRATPTYHEGRLYAYGATGWLTCLDAVTGKKEWSVDATKDAAPKDGEVKLPPWGYAASPLVAHGLVSVFVGGEGAKSVLAYDAATGKLAWTAGEGEDSYSSVQPARIAGVEQLLMSSGAGLTSLEPKTGKILWQHGWEMQKGMARVIQPAQVGDNDIILGTFFGKGTRRLRIKHDGDNWSTEEVWTTLTLKPYYNDLVIHKGYIYGFDDALLTCTDLETGVLKWKERGYEHGQLLLLPDQDLLLIISEKGSVALVQADPAGRKELGRFQALQGKTWNHPTLVRGKLFVRNGEWMACYQLPETPSMARGE